MLRPSTCTRLVTALVACGLIATASAGEPTRPREERPGPPPHAGPPHDKADRPRDGRGGPPPHARGKGPHPERAQMMRRLRAAADLDGDGKLNEQERKLMHEKRRELQQRSHQQLLKRFDEDGDGKLNQHEKANAKAHAEKRRNQMRRKLLNQFDADGDGKLNDAERENARNAMEMRIENERRNRQQQRNQRQENPATENPRPHDNQPERRRRPLQRFDTNQDGKLDDSERAAMRNAREAMRKKQPNPAELEHPQPQN